MQSCKLPWAVVASPSTAFYQATAQGKDPEVCESLRERSAYLHDLLRMSERGIWERELQQFMPPASLKAAVESLLALGLIERASPVGGVPSLQHS